MAKKRINIENYKCNFKSLHLKRVVQREPSPVDDYTHVQSDDGIFVRDPIYEAFNLDRLNKSSLGIVQWLESLQQKPLSPIAQLRAKCTDDELASMLKSRYAQSPIDALAYAQQLSNDIDLFHSEYAKLAAAQSVSGSDPTSNVESNTSE